MHGGGGGGAEPIIKDKGSGRPGNGYMVSNVYNAITNLKLCTRKLSNTNNRFNTCITNSIEAEQQNWV